MISFKRTVGGFLRGFKASHGTAVSESDSKKSFVLNKFNSVSSFLRYKLMRFSEYIEYLKLVHNRKGILGSVEFIFKGDDNTRRFKRSMASAVMTYAAPAMSAVLLFNVVISAAATDYCVSVSFNGDTVAYVQSDNVYNEAEAVFKSKIAPDLSDGQVLELEPELSVTKNVGYKLVGTEELADLLVTYTSGELTMAYGIYAGNEFITAVYDKTEIESFVNAYLTAESAKYPGSNTVLSNEIYYIEGLYLKNSVKDTQEAEAALFEGHPISVDYTVLEGDTVEALSAKFGAEPKDFMCLNPELTNEMLVPGTSVQINIYEPYLSTVCIRNETVSESIPFETVTVNDSTMLATHPEVIRVKGKEGSKNVTYQVATRNGVELSRTLINEEVTKEPTNQEVAIGTLIKITVKVPVVNGVPQFDKVGQLSNGADSTAAAGVGGYVWPVGGSGGYISCPFGGAKAHTGLDIAAPLGTPVYAATDGVVTRVIDGTTGYGRYIVIQNSDGLITYYAHCNYLAVSVGQQVTRGQYIGEVGSTGNSTGPHLHFEVRGGGTYLNPIDFVK